MAQAAIEAAQPGVTALFMTGCGADANPKPRGTREIVQQHGEALARAVRDAMPTLTPISGATRAAMELVDLPFEAALTPEQWKKRFGLEDPYVARHARLMDEIRARDGKLPTMQKMPLQVWRFGTDLTLVTLGGEVVVDYALRLRRDFPGDHVWPVGYANDVFGYVPSRRVLDEGGYEGGGALLYYGRPGPFDATVEDRIFTALESPDEEHTMTLNRSRRRFLGTVAAGGASVVAARPAAATPQTAAATNLSPVTGVRPAVLGGTPVRTAVFPSWPVQDAREEQALVSVLESGKWGRGVGGQVKAFEAQYATATGTQHCLATANGTSALLTALAAMGIGAGDEVIVPPYTFVATINAVLMLHALPVFVDTRHRDVPDRRAEDRRGDHAADAADPAGAPRRLGGRHGHDHGGSHRAQRPGARGCLPVAPRAVEGPARRLDRQGRVLLVPGEQEPEQRRGRRHHHQRPGARREGVRVPQQQPARVGQRLRLPPRRAQPPPHRVPGGAAARADDAPRVAVHDSARPTPPT